MSFFLGSWGNDSECRTNKSQELQSGSQVICCFHTLNNFPMNPEKRCSLLIFTMLPTKTVKHKLSYIHNGIIFPSLNHAKIFESFPDEPQSTSTCSLAVGQITCAVINTANEV